MQNKITAENYFKNKKITVMGLGLLGRGVGDVAFLAECGAKLTVTDLKSRRQLGSSLQKLRKYKNIRYVLGKHDKKDFQKADMILKAAGVPLDSVYIKEASKNKIPVEMSATIFAKFSNIPMIGVTGTRGKSTVTHMIDHILKSAKKKVILGGNVRGVSNLQLLKKVSPPKQGGASRQEIAVFELDSWQLQGFGDAKISPHISVFTTFFPDHMVYYVKNMANYFKDKAYIFKYQKKEDVLVAGKQTMPFIKKWGGQVKSKVITPKTSLPQGWKLGVKGEHNIYNASLALEVARSLRIKDEVIKKALKNFKGVPGRLEFVRKVDGVSYYNDTTATTPEATLAALHALGHPMSKLGNIILIMGGSDKGLDMKELIKAIPRFCKRVILLSGTGTERIKSKISNSVEVDSISRAVDGASRVAQEGDTVLLSPAFASFGMFQNEYDRGDKFSKAVRNLK